MIQIRVTDLIPGQEHQIAPLISSGKSRGVCGSRQQHDYTNGARQYYLSFFGIRMDAVIDELNEVLAA